MPELPEVEAIVRKLRRASIVGVEIAAVQVLRPRAVHPQGPSEMASAIGQRFRKLERRGKNIVLHLDGGLAFRVHLRMTGNLYVIPQAGLHTDTVRVLIALRDGRALVLDDPRLLGSVNLYSPQELAVKLRQIGIDPTNKAFTAELLSAAAKKSRKPVKVFLMDQRAVSGLGNIYSAEALFRARIHPAKPANRLRRDRVSKLHTAIRDVLNKAIPAALRSYTRPGNHAGMEYFVYDREGEPCRVCGRSIQRIEQAGRSTYFCPYCQRG
jgi:formamidopyrimidine-DNA glycosylase